MGSAAYDIDYWLACADKAHTEGKRDPRARIIMFRVARGYERLAQHAQERFELLAAIEKRESK